MKRGIVVFMALSFVFLLRTHVFASPLDEELQKLKQAGIPTTIEELNLPEIPDSENGAVVYKEAVTLILVLVEKYKTEFQNLPASGSVKWSDLPELEKQKVANLVLYNQDFSRAYQLLEKATGMKCSFFSKEDYQKMVQQNRYDDIYKPAANLRACARLLVDKAIIESDYGTIENALNACLIGLRLGKSLTNDPLSVLAINRVALLSIALVYVEKTINKGEGNVKSYQSLIDEIEIERGSDVTNHSLKGELVIVSLPYFSHYRKLGKEAFEFTEGDKKELEEKGKGVSKETLKDFERSEKNIGKFSKKPILIVDVKTPMIFLSNKKTFIWKRC